MDGFGRFLGKHIPVKCEVCEAEKDILKDTIISAIERRVATKPQNCRHTEDIEDESFESEDKEDLRHTALMRPKKSSYKVQAHPVRSNLLSIVPVEEQPESKKPKLFSAVILPNKRNSESPGKSTTTSKFNRHNDENNESSDLSSSEEEIEVEEEVTATESESEEQSTTKKGKKTFLPGFPTVQIILLRSNHS